MKRLALLVAFALSLRCPLRDSSGLGRARSISHPAAAGPAMTNASVPYYETPDGTIRIFHARWEDVRDAGIFKAKDIALIHADPPYGVNERTDRASKGRGHSRSRPNVRSRDWPAVVGDDKPFDPSMLLSLGRPTVLWGANNYHDQLPPTKSMVLWDKRRDVTPDDNADGELAWTNLGGPLRIFRHLWRAICRESEVGSPIHPTQKPEALSAWVFNHAMQRKKLKSGDTILIPYMGSGPDLRPAQALGLKVIACEVDESYCATAVNARLRAVATPLDDSKLGPLFEARS